MKISLNQKMKDIEGEVIKVNKQKGKEVVEIDLKLAKVLITALTSNFEDEKNLEGEEKVKRFIIAQKIQRKKDGVVDLSVEDVAMIKKLVGKTWGTIVVGQVWEILEK